MSKCAVRPHADEKLEEQQKSAWKVFGYFLLILLTIGFGSGLNGGRDFIPDMSFPGSPFLAPLLFVPIGIFAARMIDRILRIIGSW